MLGLRYLHLKNGAEDWRLAAAINLYPAAEGVLVSKRVVNCKEEKKRIESTDTSECTKSHKAVH